MKGFDFPYIVEFVTDAVAVYGFQISVLSVLVFLSLWFTVPHASAYRGSGEQPSATEKHIAHPAGPRHGAQKNILSVRRRKEKTREFQET